MPPGIGGRLGPLRVSQILPCLIGFVSLFQDDQSTGNIEVVGGDNLSNLRGKVGYKDVSIHPFILNKGWSSKKGLVTNLLILTLDNQGSYRPFSITLPFKSI